MVRQGIILFIFLASVDFFRLIYIPKPIILLMSFGAAILMALVVILTGIYDRGKKGFLKNFKFEINLMFAALILSMFGARYGHSQSFLLTAWAQTGMYFYFFYFFLHKVRINTKELEKLLIIMAFVYMFLYVAQYVLYPRMIVDLRMEEARGTIRIFMPGGIFAGTLFLYFLHNYFRTYKKIYLLYCLIYLGLEISKGTRSSLANLVFIIVIYVLFSQQIKSRLAVIFLMLVGAVMFFFIFQGIFMSLIEVSAEQSAQEGDDIRERAATFFLTEFYPNKLNYFIGNGTSHMASPYGLKMWFYMESHGFFVSDLGILGAFIKYGVLYILAVILILRKIFITPIEPKHMWLRYYAVLLAIGVILGEPFSQPSAIVVILSIAYIIDVSNYEILHAQSTLEETTT